MGNRDPYEVLGVQRDVSEDDLKETFRRLAMKYHPDHNQGDEAAEAKFKEVNEAYDILKNVGQRAAYDRRGHTAFEQGAAPGDGGFESIFSGGSFEFVFEGRSGHSGGTGGGQRRHQASGCGGDLRTHVEIVSEEALDGTKRTNRVPSSSVACEASGSGDTGAEPGNTPAQTCRGAGRALPDRTLSVGTLAGAEDGIRTWSAGEGEAGSCSASANGPDLDLGACAQPSLQCEGGDIFVHVPLRMMEAAPDVPLEVPVLGSASTSVPARQDSQTGDQSCPRSKRLLVLLILLLGGALIYADTPSGGPRSAAHDPGAIAAPRAPAPEAGEPASSPAPPAADPTTSAAGTPGTVDASASPAAPVADPSRSTGASRDTDASVSADAALRSEAGEPASSPAPPATDPTASARGTPGTDDASASPAAPVTDSSRLTAAAVGRTVVPETAAPRQDPNLLAALVRRGDAMFAADDVSAARLFYERAAAGGSAAGATGVGKTYDPAFLSRLNVFGIRSDPSAAATWYRKAVTLGDPEAERLLRRLGAAVAD